ncbi:hypothetical protein BC828DRAFT_386634 [Blastocladiella britannica]|nr:hypothetical protein BC828DRAFT_386634 [Blastocladiella britannica]
MLLRSAALIVRHATPTLLHTTATKMSTTIPYTATVIGAGPAGLAVVAKLLDTAPSSGTPQQQRIAWIDPSFGGGRLQAYPEVPSNTKVKLFIKFAEVSPSLAAAADKSGCLTALQACDPNKGCDLKLARDMTAGLGDALAEMHGASGRLTRVRGWVAGIEQQQATGGYAVRVDTGVVADPFTPGVPATSAPTDPMLVTDRVYLCTGSEPVPEPPAPAPHAAAPHPVTVVDLDTCLTPTKLAAVLRQNPAAKLLVVGASHSAVLCMMNAAALGVPVLNLSRHALKYAEDMGDWILYDNTGLKGAAAAWARDVLENPDACARAGITRFDVPTVKAEKGAYDAAWAAGATHIVYAIGYRTRPMPPISLLDSQATAFSHDPATGELTVKANGTTKVPGLYGYGIAFPERITDRQGNVEWSVGMWKFMRYISEQVRA